MFTTASMFFIGPIPRLKLHNLETGLRATSGPGLKIANAMK